MSFIKAADLGKKVLDDYNAAMEAKDMREKSYYKKNRAAYVEYLLMCVRLGDWHGVSDAANDLRVLEAREKPGG